MKLVRLVLGGEQLVATVEGDRATPVARGGQEVMIDLAMRRSAPPAIAEPVDLASAAILAPITQPPAFRDFMAFEAHARDAWPGGKLDPAWYEAPYFYFSNPHAIRNPGECIPVPEGEQSLDYELEVAAVVGCEALNLDPDDPATLQVICGFTILNDWSARDIQLNEMKIPLGPVKGKDFASSLGPALVTPDEFEGFETGRPRARMSARVNGETWSRGELGDIHFSWGEILAYASRNSRLLPGDVIGSGTVGTGCIRELQLNPRSESRRWLAPGDVVEFEVDHIGVLRNEVVALAPDH